MTSAGRTDVTSAGAREIHRKAQMDDAEHDRISCWCCCFDCDFNYAATIRNDEALGLPSVH